MRDPEGPVMRFVREAMTGLGELAAVLLALAALLSLVVLLGIDLIHIP